MTRLEDALHLEADELSSHLLRRATRRLIVNPKLQIFVKRKRGK